MTVRELLLKRLPSWEDRLDTLFAEGRITTLANIVRAILRLPCPWIPLNSLFCPPIYLAGRVAAYTWFCRLCCVLLPIPRVRAHGPGIRAPCSRTHSAAPGHATNPLDSAQPRAVPPQNDEDPQPSQPDERLSPEMRVHIEIDPPES